MKAIICDHRKNAMRGSSTCVALDALPALRLPAQLDDP